MLMPTSSARAIVSDLPALPRVGARPRHVAFVSLTLMVAAVQFSIAIAQIFLTLALLAWATALTIEHRRPSAPRWAIPLMLYAGWTLLSASLSLDARTSIIDCKQLVLFLIVPLTFEILEQGAALPLTTLMLAAG